MDVRRGSLGARLELRLDAKTKKRIERVAKGYGESVADFIRRLCLAELGERDGAEKERKRAARELGARGMIRSGRGPRKKGV